MYSEGVEKLIKLFAKFPTVGPRTAARFVFHLIQASDEETEDLLKSIKELKQKTKLCELCSKSFEGKENQCAICSDPRRDRSLLCVVDKEMDLEAIEETHQFKGLYFIIHGQDEEKLEKLLDRINNDGIKEVILALNPTTEGQNNTLWLKRKLNNVKTTQLARGLPVGGELEYADAETLSSALKARKSL